MKTRDKREKGKGKKEEEKARALQIILYGQPLNDRAQRCFDRDSGKRSGYKVSNLIGSLLNRRRDLCAMCAMVFVSFHFWLSRCTRCGRMGASGHKLMA